MYTYRKLFLGYAVLLALLLLGGLTCSNQTQEYKQTLVKYGGPLIQNTTFNCDLRKRLHFQPGAVLKNCIFKWEGNVDEIWVKEFTSRNTVAILTGSNLTIDECMFYGSGKVNPEITTKQ